MSQLATKIRELVETCERHWPIAQERPNVSYEDSLNDAIQCRALLRDSKDELIEALEAAEKLPVTKDGKRITRGMNLYQPYGAAGKPIEVIEHRDVCGFRFDSSLGIQLIYFAVGACCYLPMELFSSREAALAASAEKEKGK